MTFADALVWLFALVATSLIAGFALRATQARVRRDPSHEIIDPHRLGADGLGEDATLLQFSTELCARCPGVHRTLAEVADARPGVRHLDVDLSHRPDIARHFKVLQTPTTFILDRNGAIQTRFGGVPRREIVELELSRLIESPSHA